MTITESSRGTGVWVARSKIPNKSNDMSLVFSHCFMISLWLGMRPNFELM